MEFVSSCQTDDLTLIQGGDTTVLLQALIFPVHYQRKLIRIYTHKLPIISKYVLHGIIQVGRDFKMSPIQPTQSRPKVQGQTRLLRALSSWILKISEVGDIITSLDNILLPSRPLCSLSPQKLKPYFSG